MAGTTKRSLAVLGLVIATAGSLDHCAKDLARELVPDRSFDTQLQQGFGPVSRSAVGTTPEGGAILELNVTSTQRKSWTDAEMLMTRKAGCGDGRSYMPEWTQPAVPIGEPGRLIAAMNEPQPEGTTFVLRLSCEGPLPGEIDLPAGADATRALAMVRERIGFKASYDPDGVVNVAVEVPLSRETPSYEAFDKVLGSMTKMAIRTCRGPTTLEQVVTATLSEPDDQTPGWMTGQLFVGVDFACARPDDGVAVLPAAPSPP